MDSLKRSLQRPAGWACFVVALGGVLGFEYALFLIMQIGTCASGTTPYVIGRQCPPGTDAAVALLAGGFLVGLAASVATAALLGERAGSLLWAALFVLTGLQFFGVARGNGQAGLIFYGLSAMFVLMGGAPFLMSGQALEASE